MLVSTLCYIVANLLKKMSLSVEHLVTPSYFKLSENVSKIRRVNLLRTLCQVDGNSLQDTSSSLGLELRMDNVSKSYGGRRVVDRISISVKQGEVVGLLGPNGAGKSTIFNMIVGRESPSEGSVFLGDTDITKLSLQRRARLGVGYMTQVSNILSSDIFLHRNQDISPVS